MMTSTKNKQKTENLSFFFYLRTAPRSANGILKTAFKCLKQPKSFLM